jgi:RHS repeat-associated protein
MSSPAALTVRGNQTGVITYANAAAQSGAITASKQYDVAGNAVKAVDGMGYETQVSYDDLFCNNGMGCGGTSTPNTFAFPTSTTSAVPDVSTLYGFQAGTFGATQALTSSTAYDFYTGLTHSTKDANGRPTTLSYIDRWGNPDPLDRVRAVVRADGSRTDVDYNDVVGDLYARTLTDLDATRRVESYQFFDGMGRPVRSFLNEGGSPAVFITSDTEYDALGRAWRVSNPYRTSGSNDAVNPSGRWTETTCDALGRVAQVKTTADGAKVTTSYVGNMATVTDQAGRVKRSMTNAQGRLVRVDEPDSLGNLGSAATPVQSTSYTYDVLGNLLTTTQGAQTRSLGYDSLGRLTSSTNPESGTVNYTYDTNGNLATRTDARGVTVTYKYDRLYRNIITSYSGGGTSTPEVRHYYDNAANGANGLGRLFVSEAMGVSFTAYDAYDSMGRPKQYRQVFRVGGEWGQPFTVGRTYDKAGNVLTQTYPSGHSVTYNYDAAGRIADNGSQPAFAGTLGDGVQRAYASAVSYSEFGGVREERFGTQTQLYHKLHYNARGQLYSVRLSTLPLASNEFDWNRGSIVNYYEGSYNWGGAPGSTGSGPDNNGNVRRVETFVPANEQLSAFAAFRADYEYDSLNRLKWVAESRYSDWSGQTTPSFKQAYDYDRWGNRTINANETQVYGHNQGYAIPEPQFELSPQTNKEVAEPSNRLYAPGDANRIPSQKLMRYDAAGNLVHDGHTGAGERVYDAENRMTAAFDRFSNWDFYAYDAGGRRLGRKIANVEWWQVYGMGGELLAEYRAGAAPFLAAKEYGYHGGRLLVTMSSGDTDRLTRFIKNLYYNCLARDASAAELQAKTNQMAQAGAQGGEAQLLSTARFIARGLFESPEYVARGRLPEQYVTDLYNAYLQRGPDAGGLTHWVNNTNTLGPGATLNAFELSAEFSALSATVYGTAAWGESQRVDAFVRSFYLGAFQREPTAGEMQAGRQRLNNAATGREQVIAEAQAMAVDLIQGTNYNSNHTPEQYVTDLYEAFLQRAPDGPGFTYWLDNVKTLGRAAALDGFKASSEYRELAATLYRETFWLVTDHLGTPRMIIDRTGSLAGVKRHDYLPFGEELWAGVGGRTSEQGYSRIDNVRQRFTGQERDDETGLDFFGARYDSASLGRFTSPDPENAGADVSDPQSWNGYAYARNSPLKYVDPDGRKYKVCRADGGCEDITDEQFNQMKNNPHNEELGVSVTGGKIYNRSESGEMVVVGLYQRTSFDDQSDFANGVFFGTANTRGLIEQAPVAGKTAMALWGGSVLLGAGGGLAAAGPSTISAAMGLTGSGAGAEIIAGGVTRAALQRAASDTGPMVQVVTRLTQAPQAGRALSVAVGENATALANAARSGGQVYTASIPKALIETLRTANLVQQSVTRMGGTTAIEYRFAPQAAEFILQFFK